MWRPRKLGKHFRVQVELWETVSSSIREAISEQAERLAAYRQVPLSGIDLAGALTRPRALLPDREPESEGGLGSTSSGQT